MASRDSQTVILSRQAIVLVTAVGVGLLTLCYVLGVQVGKQSAALRSPQARGAGEDLQELPASVADQLKAFQKDGAGAEQLKAFERTAAGVDQAPDQKPEAIRTDASSGDRPKPDLGRADPGKPGGAKPDPAKAASAKAEPAKPEPPRLDSGKPDPARADPARADPARADPARADPASAKDAHWSLQLVSTPDAAEAQRMATKARDAGFPTVIVKDNGLLKVRLTQTGTRQAVDSAAAKLKNRGFKPFAIKAP